MTEAIASSKPVFLVVDDFDMVVEGVTNTLKQVYPDAEIVSCGTAEAVREELKRYSPDLIMVDLSIPESSATESQLDTGIQLLKELLETYPETNFVVQSAHVQTLVRIKPSIDSHQGGLTIVDKRLPKHEMLQKVDWSLQGIVYTPPEIRKVLEVRPEWIEVLQLAFEEHMQDKAIAEKMKVADKTVRNYWTRVQDVLGVYPEEGVNLRIRTGAYAREKGLVNY